MKKKFVAFLMALVLLFTFVPVQTFAAGDDLEDIVTAWNLIADAADDLDIGGSAAATTSFVDIFKGCMSVASTAGSVLTLVNGGVTFLRLIGVMDDPVAGKLNSIIDRLDTMDAKMSEMDKKLDNLTQQMSRIEAKIDLSARVQKAYDMEKAWKDFSQYYMDDKLDLYMANFKTTVTDGMQRWFNSASDSTRYIEETGIDNRIIVLKYVKDKNGKFVLNFVNDNEIPESCGEDEQYLLIKANCVPGKMTWNIGTYTEDLTDALASLIKTALGGDPADSFSTCRYVLPTKEDDEAILALASDAAEALKYRVGSAAIRNKGDFASNVVYFFGKYCEDLLESNDGMDARYKSFYLTHAFEYQVKKDLADFSEQMILKTGVYAAFVSDVMGMSAVFGDTEKENTMKLFADTVKALDKAQENALTGNDRYCYVTNTVLNYTLLAFDSTISAKLVKDGVYWNFKSIEGGSISHSYANDAEGTLVGDSQMLLLSYVMRSSGISDLAEAFYYHLDPYNVTTDYGRLVTSFNDESELALDSGAWMESNYVCGDYFQNVSGLYLNRLPDEDASSKCISHNRKVSGNVFNLDTGEPETNVILHAVAAYGETSKWWFEDEIALFGGPMSRSYSSGMNSPTGYNRTYSLHTVSKYDALLSNPLPAGTFGSGEGYHPLSSFKKLADEFEIVYVTPTSGHKTTEPTIVLSGTSGGASLGDTNPDTGAPVELFPYAA